jgi:hypothetical protein
MYVRNLFALMAILLAGCQFSRERTEFHLNISGGDGRETARRIQQALGRFAPLVIYDESTEELNIILSRNASFHSVRAKLARSGINPSHGLVNPTRNFIDMAECVSSGECDVSAITECRFQANISDTDFRNYYESFSRIIMTSGYPALGVVYSQNGAAGVTLSVPYYDQCDSGARHLNSGWRLVSHSEQDIFQDSTEGSR